MRALDFEYDGKRLSDFGFLICEFDGKKGVEATSLGSTIKFNKVPYRSGRKNNLVSIEYKDCIEASFDICRDPDCYDDPWMTDDDFRHLTRWLCKESFLPVRFVYEPFEKNVYYNAAFNLSRLTIADRLCGIRVKMETDSPFGYEDERRVELSVNPTVTPLGPGVSIRTPGICQYTDDSDCVIFPKLKIECLESGTLKMANISVPDMDVFDTLSEKTNAFTIDNCVNGETIEIDGDLQTISTDSALHGATIHNDFSYTFLPIKTDINDISAWITATLKCNVTVIYNPLTRTIP